ncbi:hypothetical protein WKV53_27765 [Luteolibacter sp. Y139]|uniref:Uncharacterized protein n=1 Tax=Luteolibacter soli TaxID=3135280 RepID=A0ABU9B4S6_9BACT
MPTSRGDRHCSVVIAKNLQVDEATHLTESDLIYQVTFEGIIREKRRTLAVFHLVRPACPPVGERIDPKK